MGILFRKSTDLFLEAYTNANYTRLVVDKRSTSSYYAFLGGNFMTWRGKKQLVIGKSSTEVKFKAMT